MQRKWIWIYECLGINGFLLLRRTGQIRSQTSLIHTYININISRYIFSHLLAVPVTNAIAPRPKASQSRNGMAWTVRYRNAHDQRARPKPMVQEKLNQRSCKIIKWCGVYSYQIVPSNNNEKKEAFFRARTGRCRRRRRWKSQFSMVKVEVIDYHGELHEDLECKCTVWLLTLDSLREIALYVCFIFFSLNFLWVNDHKISWAIHTWHDGKWFFLFLA